MGASSAEGLMGANPYAAAGVAGVGAITSVISAISEGKRKKKIAREIANLKENPLTNIAEGLQVSTRGADLQKEQQARLATTQVNTLQDAGSRALIGGIGSVSAANADVAENIGADLDMQQKQIDQIRAQDQGNIRGIKEQRAANKLAALSSQYNAANQSQQMGIGNALQGLDSAAMALPGSKVKTPRTPVTPVSEINPRGVVR